jgi:hypothetical protein
VCVRVCVRVYVCVHSLVRCNANLPLNATVYVRVCNENVEHVLYRMCSI